MLPTQNRPALALLLLLAPAAAQRGLPDPRLKDAQRLLRERGEGKVREGARLCLAIGNRDSMELLLDVLDSRLQHMRDIVWEVLPAYTDPYARKRVEHELRTNKKNAEVRQWCAELLGIYGDQDFGATLAASLTDRAVPVVRAAVRSLGSLRFGLATRDLEKLVPHKDIYVREAAIAALARIDPEAHLPLFRAGLHDPDGGVRCALLGWAPRIYPALVEELSTEALGDQDWRPRIQAVENLAALRTKTAVDSLVRGSGDGRPVVRLAAVAALQTLTTRKFTERREWEAWWRDHRATFDFAQPGAAGPAEGAAPRTVARYHGIEVTSDHVAFLIDKSNTMLTPLAGQRITKEKAAEDELAAVLATLLARGAPRSGEAAPELTFNVFTYEDEVVPFQKGPVRLDQKTRRNALEFVDRAACKGNKNIWLALTTVVEDPTLDTIYLLSSGEPEVGLYVHWNRVTLHLAELNRFHKVVIHCVSWTDNAWYREQLENIARCTGGQFKAS